MPVTVEVKLNGVIIAAANIGNISNLADVSDYSGHVIEDPQPELGIRGVMKTFLIKGHPRKQSVWALIERVARIAQGKSASDKFGQ